MGLGSNLGDPSTRIHDALNDLDAREDIRVVRVSSLYRNPPMGPADQPDYVNAVAGLETSLGPGALLDAFQELERAAGRTPNSQRWQARTLDLDLLLFGSLRLESLRLTVPHPGVHERSFVIHPLAEIAADVRIPGFGRVADLAAKVDASRLERIAGPPSIGQ